MKKNISLKRALTWNQLILAVLPVLVISSVSFFVLNINLNKEIARRNTLIAASTAQEINVFLGEALNSLNQVKDIGQQPINNIQMEGVLKSLLRNYKYFESVQILDEKSNIINTVPSNSHLMSINQSGQDYVKKVKESGQPYWSSTFISVTTGQPSITLSIPYKKGAIVGFINLSELENMASEITIGKESFAVIVDQNGTYLAHPNKDKIFQRETDEFFKRNSDHFKSGIIYKDKLAGKDMLLNTEVVDFTNWRVIIYQSRSEAFASAENIRIIGIIVTFLALLLTLLMSMLSLRKIFHGIDRLTQGIKEIRAGNYTMQETEKSYEEINELVKSFSFMAEEIEQREEELRMNNETLEETLGELVKKDRQMKDQYIQLQDSNKKLEFISYHDTMTGLFNRAYFEERIAKLQEIDAKDSKVGIIMLDFDGLKFINDTRGHQVGDKMLIDAAYISKTALGNHGEAARIGGDEFAMILPNTTKEILEEICNTITKEVTSFNNTNKDYSFMSLSIGFSLQREEEYKTIDEVLKEADYNMYRAKLHQGQSVHNSNIQTLIKALEARDFITEGHSERMEALVESVGLQMGMAPNKIFDLRLLSRFHDIGKVGIPDGILFKEGSLSSDEWVIMQRHSEIGYRIAQASSELKPIANLILKHHEYWDGKGYPLQLKGEEVPLECRILSVVDAFDAMTNDRPYRKAMSIAQAIAELERCAGKQFDPHIVEIFIDIISEDSDHHPSMDSKR